MNTLERISRHSRGYKAERRWSQPVSLPLVFQEYPSRPLVNRHPSRRFNAAYYRYHWVSIAQWTRSFDLMVHTRADFPAEAAALKIIRACRIALAWLRGTRVTIAVCFLSSRSIYRPSDSFASFVDADPRHDLSFYLSSFLPAALRSEGLWKRSSMWTWIMTLENWREKIQDLKMRYIKDAKVWYR